MKFFHRIHLLALVLAIALCLAPAALATSPATATDAASFQADVTGSQTKGVTFASGDVYYDGTLLLATLTMTPNDDALLVCDAELGWSPEAVDPAESKGLIPICAYCDLTVADAEGKVALSPMTGGGLYTGNGFSKTFAFHFSPDATSTNLVATVTYGVQDAPGALTSDALKTFQMLIPVQKQATLRKIALNNLPEELSYLKRIVVAQSDELASVFVYFAPTDNTATPVAFVDDGTEISNADLTAEAYIFRAYRTAKLEKLQLRDTLSGKVYEVDLATGTATLMK